jgi:hypothetical protein
MEEKKMTRIKKNSREVKALWGLPLKWMAFADTNYYNGKPTSVEWVKKEFERFSFAKLYRTDKGYTVHITNRCWYEGC